MRRTSNRRSTRSRPARPISARAVGHRPRGEQCSRQRDWLIHRYELAGHVVFDDLRVAADSGRHDWQTAGHRLQERERDPLALGWQDESGRPSEQSRHVPHIAQKPDMRPEVEFGGQSLKPRPSLPIAGNLEAKFRPMVDDNRRSAKKSVYAFGRYQPADHHDWTAGRWAEIPEPGRVNPVVDDGELPRQIPSSTDSHMLSCETQTIRSASRAASGRPLDAGAGPDRLPVPRLDHGGPGQPCRGGAVDERGVIVRVNDIGPRADELSTKSPDRAGSQPRRGSEAPHLPPVALNLVRYWASILQTDEMKFEPVAVGVPGHLHQQFLHTAGPELAHDVGDPQLAAIPLRVCCHVLWSRERLGPLDQTGGEQMEPEQKRGAEEYQPDDERSVQDGDGIRFECRDDLEVRRAETEDQVGRWRVDAGQ